MGTVRLAITTTLLFTSCFSTSDRVDRGNNATVRELQAREGECFLHLRLDTGDLSVSNAAECDVPSSPASTFKLPHALIALETGVLADAGAIQKWDGTEQPFDAWERDHTLDSAIQSSVVWFFRRTAAAIGRERMTEWLGKLQYAKDTFDRDPTYFWLDGDLVISPREQLNFISRLFRDESPVRRPVIEFGERAARNF